MLLVWCGVPNLFDARCWVSFVPSMILRFNIQHNQQSHHHCQPCPCKPHFHINLHVHDHVNVDVHVNITLNINPNVYINANANIKITNNTNSPKLKMICTAYLVVFSPSFLYSLKVI